MRPQARPFGKIAFGECLQAPRDAPEQMLAMPRQRFLFKHHPILLAQNCQ
jgi:hypothetical protein